MRQRWTAAIFLISMPLAGQRHAHPEPAGPSDPGGVLHELTIATLGGSGQTTIQALATDAAGNMYAAGATSAADFPVKNAAQPTLGDVRILRTTDLGKTWTRVGSPPEDVSNVVSDPTAPQVLFASGAHGVYKSTDSGQTWREVYAYPAVGGSTGSIAIDPGNHLRLAALSPE